MKKFLNKVFKIPLLAIAVCCVLSFALLIYVFAENHTNEPIAYLTYFLSAYSLTVLLVYVIPIIISKILKQLSKIPLINRYLNDRFFRARVSIYFGLLTNTLFSLFYFIMAIRQESYLQMTLAIYNFIFSLMRFALVRKYRQSLKTDDAASQRLLELKGYRLTGVLMFFLNFSMTILIMFWIRDGKNALGEFMTITLAVYTFFYFINAMINVIKFKITDSPTIVASKCVTFSRTLVSMFSLQIAMFTQFATMDQHLEFIINIITGALISAVCLGPTTPLERMPPA